MLKIFPRIGPWSHWLQPEIRFTVLIPDLRVDDPEDDGRRRSRAVDDRCRHGRSGRELVTTVASIF